LDFDFQEAGLNTPGGPLPVLRMPWVKGPTLLSFVKNQPDRAVLSHLREQLFHFSCEQVTRSFAHGDVQPRNILVEGARLKFVDYDGMFVPGIESLGSADLGHPDFQSPQRGPEHFGPWLDRFSLIALDLSLQALTYEPRLLEEFDKGDNLLLTKRDFVSPVTSPALKKLELISDIKSNVTLFRDLCSQPCSKLPTLEQYRAAKVWVAAAHPSPPDDVRQVTYRPNCQVIEGGLFSPENFSIGTRLEVVGRVAQVANVGMEVRIGFGRSGNLAVAISERVFQAWSRRSAISVGTPVSVTGAVERRKGPMWRSEAFLVACSVAELEVLPNPDWIRYRLGELEMEQAFRSGIAVSEPAFVRKRRTQTRLVRAADLRAAATQPPSSQSTSLQSPISPLRRGSESNVKWVVFALAVLALILLVLLSGH
jgi:hypothetical protein